MNNLTELEQATADQLATERGHKAPTDADIADALVLVSGWNRQREVMGLPLWI